MVNINVDNDIFCYIITKCRFCSTAAPMEKPALVNVMISAGEEVVEEATKTR